MHLVDPIGSLVEFIKLLKPKTGFFIFDGFSYDCGIDELPDAELPMTELYNPCYPEHTGRQSFDGTKRHGAIFG